MTSRRRVLFIALAFPPHNSSGTLRAAAFVKYLGDFGWQPIVLTLDWEKVLPPEALDFSQLEDLPPQVSIYRLEPFHPILQMSAMIRSRALPTQDRQIITHSEVPEEEKPRSWFYRMARSMYHGMLAPVGDEHFYWLWRAIPDALEIALHHQVEVITVSLSPWTSGLLGLILARVLGLPLVLDFRDYWTAWPIKPRRPVRDRLDALAERLLLRSADRVICVHDAMADDFARIDRRVACRCVVIPNGYDPADFPSFGQAGGISDVPFHALAASGARWEPQAAAASGCARALSSPRHRPVTTFVHTGMVWGDAARPLLDALTRLHSEGIDAKLRVRFVGGLPSSNLRFIRDSGLEPLVTVEPRMPHRVALARMKEADVLLLLITRHEGGRKWYPGKLFEYLAAGKPVLAIAPAGIATHLIEEAGVGTSLDPADATRLVEMLRWIADEPEAFREKFYHPRPSVIARYDRRCLTARLAETLTDVCSDAHKADVST